MWEKQKKGKNMSILEQEQKNIEQIPALLEESGMLRLVKARVNLGTTRQGATRLEIFGPGKMVFMDESSGLESIRQGRIKLLVENLVKANGALPVNMTAPELLAVERFRQACVSEVLLPDFVAPNTFLQSLKSRGGGQIPIFYGSTAGINFAEVLETALAAKALNEKGIRSMVIFDFDGRKSCESDAIFFEGLRVLSGDLKERMVNLSKEKGLMGARLESVKDLIERVPNFPEIDFVDGLDVFQILGGDFTLGQLLLMARMAGNDPRVLTQESRIYTANTLLGDSEGRICDVGHGLNTLRTSFAQVLSKRLLPAGFSYYARDAVIGKMPGIVGVPLKLTEAANIYKVMLTTDSLFNPATGSGALLLPITRFRIQSKLFGRPIDPMVLRFLAEEEPESFCNLIGNFQAEFKVLTPDEAIAAGTSDRRFFIEDYFSRGGLSDE